MQTYFDRTLYNRLAVQQMLSMKLIKMLFLKAKTDKFLVQLL